jgi:acyl carrier protein
MGLEIVELIMLAEERFEIEIKDEDMAFVSTCGQFCNLIKRKLEIDTGDIWPEVRQMIAELLLVPLEKVTREAEFVRDLGVG